MKRNAELEFMKILRDCQRHTGNRILFMADAMKNPKHSPAARMMVRAFLQGLTDDGGPGSGNWGHKGRPGKVGGSGKGGGNQYRGGRGDIAYTSSKRDWLNGLKGETQHKASKFLKECKYLWGDEAGKKSPEQAVMESAPPKTKKKLLDYMSEARGWDQHASRLIDANLDDNDRKLLSALSEKYGKAFTGGSELPDESDTDSWDEEDLRTWQDLKSKAMGGPTSGREAPDELQYAAGLKERPKPKGPDYGFMDAPRHGLMQMKIEEYMGMACGERIIGSMRPDDFAQLNQKFVDRLAYDTMTPAQVRDFSIRAVTGIRLQMQSTGAISDYTPEMFDRLNDAEKARLLECANEFSGSIIYGNKYQSLDQLNNNAFDTIEYHMRNASLRTEEDQQMVKDYMLLQEKMLLGIEPGNKEEHEKAKEEERTRKEEERKRQEEERKRRQEEEERKKKEEAARRAPHIEAAKKALQNNGLHGRIESAKTVDEVADAINLPCMFRGDQKASFSGMHLETAKAAAVAYSEMYQRFPFLVGEIDAPEAKTASAFRKAGTYAHSYLQVGGKVEFNTTTFFGDVDKVARSYESDVRSRFHPEGTDWRGIVYHEIGHSLDGWLSGRGVLGSELFGTDLKGFSGILRGKVMKKLGLTYTGYKGKSTVISGLSEYATKNSKEWFAECIGEAMTSKNPRPIAKTCLQMTLEAIKAAGMEVGLNGN